MYTKYDVILTEVQLIGQRAVYNYNMLRKGDDFMFTFLGHILSILPKIFVWGMLLLAVWTAVAIILKWRSVEKLPMKNILTLIACSTYVCAFIVLKIFAPGAFDTIASLAFFAILIISTQWAKYQDRVAGRRWWTD
ncbi:MAG: hypothetical protein GXY05_00660 [Clostridiales bacterium]|nr:hypothetical protein [Clostridiales bacterium]